MTKRFLFILLALTIATSCSKDDDGGSNCAPVNFLQAQVESGTTAYLSWDYTSEDPNISFVVEYGPEGFAVGTGTVRITQSNELRLTDLTGGTPYSYYVKVKCSDGSFSENIGPKNFTTLECEAITTASIIYVDETMAALYWDQYTDLAAIEYGLEGFQIGSGTTVQVDSNEYLFQNLTPSTTYDVYLRNICGNQYSEYSDVVRFTTLDMCKRPNSIYLITFGQTYVQIGWDRQGESAWQVEYGLVGFNLGSGMVLNTSDSSIVIDAGINPGTTYEFYVRTNCGSNGYSGYTGPLVITTAQ